MKIAILMEMFRPRVSNGLEVWVNSVLKQIKWFYTTIVKNRKTSDRAVTLVWNMHGLNEMNRINNIKKPFHDASFRFIDVIICTSSPIEINIDEIYGISQEGFLTNWNTDVDSSSVKLAWKNV